MHLVASVCVSVCNGPSFETYTQRKFIFGMQIAVAALPEDNDASAELTTANGGMCHFKFSQTQ